MKLTKTLNLGKFAKLGQDFKDGEELIILSEGQEVEGQWGPQVVFRIRTAQGSEMNLAFNATSRNKLIDAYGEETKQWIEKPVKVWAVNQVVSGKMRKVVYVTAPDQAIFDEDEGSESIPF